MVGAAAYAAPPARLNARALARASPSHAHTRTHTHNALPGGPQYQDEAARKKSLQYLMADAKSLDTNGYHTQFVLFTPHDFRGGGAEVDSLEIVRFTMPSACGRKAAPREAPPPPP